MTSNRIDYIDLAKGICIILVVLYHTCQMFELADNAIMYIASSFRMPLYFILSGLFFKEYNGITDFIKRKTNKLLVPFFVFYIFLSLCLPTILDIFDGQFSLRHFCVYLIGWTRGSFFNAATWFLLSLFVTNIIFYFIIIISKKTHYPLCSIIILSIIFGTIGCLCSYLSISLPLYSDTALTVTPFFCFGYILRKYTMILYPNRFDKYNILLIFIFCLVLYIPYKSDTHLAFLRSNVIKSNPFLMYLCGISGTMVVLLLSKYIKRIPYISYIGRYSIMILLTHYALLRIINRYFLQSITNSYLECLLVFCVVMLISSLLIPFFCRYMPKYTAQKDLIK